MTVCVHIHTCVRVRVVSVLIKINVVSNEKLSFSILFFFVLFLSTSTVLLLFLGNEKNFNVNTHQFIFCLLHHLICYVCVYTFLSHMWKLKRKVTLIFFLPCSHTYRTQTKIDVASTGAPFEI